MPAKSEAIGALDLAIAANHLPLHGAVLRQVDVERPLAGVELHARLMRGLRIGLARIEHGDRADVLVVEIENGEVALQRRSEEHTSELQSLMRTSSAVFSSKKK